MRLRRLFTKVLAVLAIGILASTIAGAPAEAASNRNCKQFGDNPDTLFRYCLNANAINISGPGYNSYLQFSIDVLVAPHATSAPTCLVTGWATIYSRTSTWDTTHVVKDCQNSLDLNIEWNYHYWDTYTVGIGFMPHGCLTFRWDNGTYWQDCFAGYTTWADGYP